MLNDVLTERAKALAPADAVEQERVLAELLQQYVLASLSRAHFFTTGCFHGGTYLRIVHGLQRFSEDLDFQLREPDPEFAWEPYLTRILADCRAEGIQFEAIDRSAAPTAVKKAFLKTDSIGTVLHLELPFPRDRRRKFKIKLEVDTNPPGYAELETHYIDFPRLSAMTTHTLATSFASKSHALLCRQYVKGRDWYDFLWYVARRVVPRWRHLACALQQTGPWSDTEAVVTPEWFVERLHERIDAIDWQIARRDVEPFLVAAERQTLELWRAELFHYQADRLLQNVATGA